MFNRLSCALAASILLSIPSIVTAGPITYDFSGTLPWPVYGTQQFTGSFTINANPVVVGSGDNGFKENGSDVSITLDVGGHTISFANTPQNPNVAQLIVDQIWSSTVIGASSDLVIVTGGGQTTPGSDPILTGFGLRFGNSADTLFSNLKAGQLATINMQNFDFSTAQDSSGIPLGAAEANYGSAGTWVPATLTSVEAASVPEPSSVIVLAVLGIGAMVYERRHRRRTPTGRL